MQPSSSIAQPSRHAAVPSFASDLGPRVGEARGRMFAGGWLIYVGLILISSAVLGAVSAFREAPDLLTALTQAAGIAGLGGGIGAVLLFVSAWRWRQVVTIFQHGVHHRQLIGERWIRFSDLTCAHHETTSYKGSAREHVRFCFESGKKVVISDVTDARMLASMANTAARSRGGHARRQ